MSTVETEFRVESERGVRVTDDELVVRLADGRTISVPLEWYPRLLHATHKESRNVRLIGRGTGLHWPDLDEDISVRGLVLGKRSGESAASFDRWWSSKVERDQEPLLDDEFGQAAFGASAEVNRHTMQPWVVEALQILGGRGTIKDICRVVWKRHGREIRAAGDAFFEWAYEVRWTGDLLRRARVLKPKAATAPGIWELDPEQNSSSNQVK